MKKKLFILTSLFYVLSFRLANAAKLFQYAPSFKDLLQKVVTLLLQVIASLGIIGFLITSIMYLTSSGNEEWLKTAKKYFIYGIVGLVIAIGSLIILSTIEGLIGAKTNL